MNVMQRFRINELSAVDHPAQVHAKMTIMKRDDEIDELRRTSATRTRKFKSDSPAGDSGFTKKEPDMSDLEKKVGELEAQVSTLTKKNDEQATAIVKLTTERDAAVAKAGTLEKAAEIAKSDEVLKVGETEVRKSVVGEASFAIFKAQQAAIEKAEDRAEMATLEKRASDEFGHVALAAPQVAAVLKAAKALPEEVAKSIETLLSTNEKLAKAGFNSIGVSHAAPRAESAAAEIAKRASEHADKHNVSIEKATEAVLAADPQLYARHRAERLGN